MTMQEVDRRCAIGGTLAGVVVAALIALVISFAFASVVDAEAQRDIPGCNSVVEWRYEGQGETWDSKPLICVPDNGQINIGPKPRGAHYRVRRGLMISLFTTDSGLADEGGCRDLAADGARQGHGLFDTYLGDWYWAYIMPGWHVSMILNTCEANSIPPCDPGICGEWH